MPHFDTAEDIRPYGRMIGEFSDTSKLIARGMAGLQFPPEDLARIIGAGKYNTLDAKEPDPYVIYGPEKTAAAKSNRTGMFGLFPIIHEPYRKLSLEAPILLGKAGCRLRIERNGVAYSAPLDKVLFDFTNGSYDSAHQQRTQGQIVLRKNCTLQAADGSSITLPAGMPLTSAKPYRYAGARMAPRKWNDDAQQKISIIDGKGQPLPATPSIVMLWGHVGAMGFKKHGRGTPEFSTLLTDGVDDDFTAEMYMIFWMNALKEKNGIEMMPHFNRYIADAGKKMQCDPELMQSLSLALATSESLKDLADPPYVACTTDQRDLIKLRQKLNWLETTGPTITALIDTFGLKLPPPDPDYIARLPQRVRAVHDYYDSQMRAILIDTMITGKKNELHARIAQSDPFSPDWIEGSGNRITEHVGNRVDKLIGDLLATDGDRILAATSKRLSDQGVNALQRSLNYLANGVRRPLPFHSSQSNTVLEKEGRRAFQSLVDAVAHCKGSEPQDMRQQIESIRRFATLLSDKLPATPMEDRNHRRKEVQNRKFWRNTALPKLNQVIALLDHCDGDLGKLYALYGDVSFLDRLTPSAAVTAARTDGDPLPLGFAASEALRSDAGPAAATIRE